MNCTQTQPLLDAYADHALNAWQTFRVRRHLAGCAACTAHLADIHRLTAAVRAWQDVPAPANLASQIAAALPLTAAVRTPPRDRRVARRVAVGLAGVAAAIGAGFWLLPGHPSQPTIAYADVEQAMQQVQTVSWHTEQQMEENPGHKSEQATLAFTTWLRRNPAALAWTDFTTAPPHSFSQIKNFPIKTLIDSRGDFSLSRNECTVAPTRKPVRQEVEDQMQRFTQFPQAAVTSKSLGLARTTVTNFHQGNVMVNGQSQVRFDWDSGTVWVAGSKKMVSRVFHVTTWASLQTRRVIRVEARLSQDTTGIRLFTVMIQDHFHYNQAPPPGVFDWSPPPGTKLERH